LSAVNRCTIEMTPAANSIVIAFAIPLVALPCLAQSFPTAAPEKQRPDPGFSIFVTASTTLYKLGEPVQVTVTVTNNTNHDVFWSAERVREPQYMACRYDLERNGHEVETTFFHRKITGRNRVGDPNEVYSGSSILLREPPGKIFDMKIDLARLYEITEPGEYTLRVSRYDEGTRTTVHANVVTIRIER
jgi:hypothetical protein